MLLQLHPMSLLVGARRSVLGQASAYCIFTWSLEADRASCVCSMSFGGSNIRPESTGYGTVYFGEVLPPSVALS